MVDDMVSFRLAKDKIEQLNECAKSVGMNRSEFLVWLFETALPLIPIISQAMKKPLQNAIQEKGATLEDY